MNPLAIRGLILLAGAAIAFGAGWSANGWRLGQQIVKMERDHALAVASAQEAARVKERALNKQMEDARNAATQRENILRRAADGARGAADRLRDQLADTRRRIPELTDQAVRRYADTLSVVFGECTAAYRDLAEQADRIDSDRQTLEDGWPK